MIVRYVTEIMSTGTECEIVDGKVFANRWQHSFEIGYLGSSGIIKEMHLSFPCKIQAQQEYDLYKSKIKDVVVKEEPSKTKIYLENFKKSKITYGKKAKRGDAQAEKLAFWKKQNRQRKRDQKKESSQYQSDLSAA